MDPDYLPFHPNPTKPKFAAPPGAVDAHCHVFGPAARFPYSAIRKYTPCDAPWEKLKELREFLAPQFAKWWLPDRIEFVTEIPKTAVGKFRKTALREQFSKQPAETA